MNRYNPS